MNHFCSEDLLILGKVIRPHGLGGLLRILSYAQSEQSFLKAESVFLRQSSGEMHRHKVLSVRPIKNVFLLELEGLHSLDDAEKCREAEILVRKDLFRDEQEEAFFWHELIGLEVYLDTGRFIGRIKHILPTGSNDIYVVQDGKKEVLIPAIHDVVKDIDLEKKRMTISEMEGLLDLNEI